jgi:MOSC domain-containing protein YiiM
MGTFRDRGEPVGPPERANNSVLNWKVTCARRVNLVVRQPEDAPPVVILSIQVGLPRSLGRLDAADPMDRVWTTGFFKEPVAGPVWLGQTNLAGDGQADLQNHGGLEKAVNIYPSEHYPYWETELGIARLPRGAFGENFTTAGLLEAAVCIGDVFEIGRALVQVSQPRQPCWKLARRWRVKDLALRVQETGRTGWYFRVLRKGTVEAGERLVLVDRLHPEWTVAAANQVMHHHKAGMAAARVLSECPALSKSWRETLARRVATGAAASTAQRLDGPRG